MKQRRDFIQSALAASFTSGVYTELVAADAKSGKFPHRAIVIKLENLTHNIKRVSLRPNDEFAFTPGQHVLLKVPTLRRGRAAVVNYSGKMATVIPFSGVHHVQIKSP